MLSIEYIVTCDCSHVSKKLIKLSIREGYKRNTVCVFKEDFPGCCNTVARKLRLVDF